MRMWMTWKIVGCCCLALCLAGGGAWAAYRSRTTPVEATPVVIAKLPPSPYLVAGLADPRFGVRDDVVTTAIVNEPASPTRGIIVSILLFLLGCLYILSVMHRRVPPLPAPVEESPEDYRFPPATREIPPAL